MKKFATIITSIALAFAACTTLISGNVLAMSVREGAEAARADGMPAELIGQNGVFTRITNTVLYIIGVIAVIMLIWGGLRYVLSGGDSKKVTDAKNTILYAIIGLIISILAFAIVNFVINAVSTTPTTSSTPETSEQTEATE